MTYNDEYYMRLAYEEALIAFEEDEAPIGAVVVCSGRVIARAHNRTEHLNDPTAHAEMLAITAATGALGAKYLINCSLYVTIEPCIMCAGAIGWSQLTELIFGASDEKRGFSRLTEKALHPKTTIRTGVMQNECATLMKEFFKRKR
jgi:tRNA(adenine34) deaminase